MDITLTESYFFPLLAFARQYVGSGMRRMRRSYQHAYFNFIMAMVALAWSL